MHPFATTPLGIFPGTIGRSMPQFGLLLVLVMLPQGILFRGAGLAIVWPQFAALAAIGAAV